MDQLFALAAAPVVPIAYVVGAIAARFSPPTGATSAVTVSAGLAFAAAMVAAATLALGGDPIQSAWRFFEPLSAILQTLTAFVGLVIVRYAANYLHGDQRRGEFLCWLSLTLAAVSTLVIAGDIILFVAAWIATSLALHKLLLFRSTRPRAIIAARKKFIAARVGDAALIGAAYILADAFETTRIPDILAGAQILRETGQPAVVLLLAPVLLVIAAVLKSAQFPTHGWLVEVMETPTPVSALLHAGIVNAGGFLIIRFADVMLLNAPAMHALALIGGFTALFGSVVMLTQTSVKAALAYSTAAQMGFMLMQCGLGAFASATLHIVAHSLYKAHAFLSSGRAVRDVRIARPPVSSRARDVLGAVIGASAIYFGIGALFGGLSGLAPAVIALGLIFALGVAMYLNALAATPRGAIIGAALAAGASTIFFVLQRAIHSALDGTVPQPGTPDAIGWWVIALATSSFALLALAQIKAIGPRSGIAQRFQIHASRGFYANAVFNRLIGALRVKSLSRQ